MTGTRRFGGRLAASLGAAAALFLATSAAAENRDSFSYQGWEGWAFYQDGQFRHCVASGVYSDGTSLSFFYDDAGFKLAVRSPDWSIVRGDSYRVRVRVDPGLDGHVDAVAPTADSLLVPMAALREPVDAIRRGYTLTLSAEALGRTRFDLTGTYVILRRVIDCYVRHD
jgi:hypothetical protein